jgi:hypothetical protein
MVKPWEWGRASNGQAVTNARSAATELSRLRVEREEVELFLAGLDARRTPATPQPA